MEEVINYGSECWTNRHMYFSEPAITIILTHHHMNPSAMASVHTHMHTHAHTHSSIVVVGKVKKLILAPTPSR